MGIAWSSTRLSPSQGTCPSHSSSVRNPRPSPATCRSAEGGGPSRVGSQDPLAPPYDRRVRARLTRRAGYRRLLGSYRRGGRLLGRRCLPLRSRNAWAESICAQRWWGSSRRAGSGRPVVSIPHAVATVGARLCRRRQGASRTCRSSAARISPPAKSTLPGSSVERSPQANIRRIDQMCDSAMAVCVRISSGPRGARPRSRRRPVSGSCA